MSRLPNQFHTQHDSDCSRTMSSESALSPPDRGSSTLIGHKLGCPGNKKPPASPLQAPFPAISLQTARRTDRIPCLVGTSQMGAQQKVGMLLLHEPVNVAPILYGEDEDDGAEEMAGQGEKQTEIGTPKTTATTSAPSPPEGTLSPPFPAHTDGVGLAGPPISLPPGRGLHLVIFFVPAHMITSELLQFVSPFRDDIRLLRIVSHRLPAPSPSLHPSIFAVSALASFPSMRDPPLTAGDPSSTHSPLPPPYATRSQPAKYMALLEMTTSTAADAFYHEFNGRPFNSLEPTLCAVGFLKGILFRRPSAPHARTGT